MRNSRYLPIAGCVAAILEWIKNAIDEALQSPWLSDPAIIPPNPDPVEVVERPSSSTVPLSPSPNEPHDFDIFLSFRGKDTRNGFTGHLHQALCGRGLKTFIDNEDLHRGETIEKLFGYIERSKVFVPIISKKGYADSKWCLKEIAKIVSARAGGRSFPSSSTSSLLLFATRLGLSNLPLTHTTMTKKWTKQKWASGEMPSRQ